MSATPKEGGPAFPVNGPSGNHPGMTLRDYFAAAALQGILAHSTPCNDQAWKSDQCAAEWSYKLADAMLAERQKEGA